MKTKSHAVPRVNIQVDLQHFVSHTDKAFPQVLPDIQTMTSSLVRMPVATRGMMRMSSGFRMRTRAMVCSASIRTFQEKSTSATGMLHGSVGQTPLFAHSVSYTSHMRCPPFHDIIGNILFWE